MITANNQTIKDVYKFRSLINPIYTRDIRFESDLVDSMYDSLSDTGLIEAYSFDLAKNNISITLKETATEQDVIGVVESIGDTIQEYVLRNQKYIQVNESDQEEFNKFINYKSLLFEHFILGKKICITL